MNRNLFVYPNLTLELSDEELKTLLDNHDYQLSTFTVKFSDAADVNLKLYHKGEDEYYESLRNLTLRFDDIFKEGYEKFDMITKYDLGLHKFSLLNVIENIMTTKLKELMLTK